MAAATVGVLIATAINVGIVRSQWRAMKRQTKAMEDANTINRSALELAKSNAASNNATTAESLKLTRQNLDVTRGALAFSRQSSEATQRAWVVMSGISAIELVPDKETPITIEFKNVGKSPAKLRDSIGVVAIGKSFPVNPDYRSTGGEPSIATLGPDQPTYVNLKNPALGKPAIEAIDSGQIRLYVYGRIIYIDMFGKPRRTLFCSFYVSPRRGLDVCATHNDWD